MFRSVFGSKQPKKAADEFEERLKNAKKGPSGSSSKGLPIFGSSSRDLSTSTMPADPASIAQSKDSPSFAQAKDTAHSTDVRMKQDEGPASRLSLEDQVPTNCILLTFP